MTPSIHLEKVDTPTLKQDGQEQADRDDPKQALKMDADNIGITFIITNTSKTDPATGDGAWYKASDLNLSDSTIVGDAHVDMDSLTYPDNWDTLVLKPGESVSVTGTLKGVKEGDTHTDRAIVTGTPLVECAPSNGDPFNDKTDGGEDTDPEYSTGDVTEIDGKQYLLAEDTGILQKNTTINGITTDANGVIIKRILSVPISAKAVFPLAVKAPVQSCCCGRQATAPALPILLTNTWTRAALLEKRHTIRPGSQHKICRRSPFVQRFRLLCASYHQCTE